MLRNVINLLISVLVLSFISFSIYAQDCTCTEFIYLNDVNGGGAIHKVRVNSDGTLTEIGSPWYPGSGVSELSSPHGLGTDLNGYLYIGASADPGGDIRKLDCEGNLFPTSDFVIPDIGPRNVTSIGNILYTNGQPDTNFEEMAIYAFDLCTGEEIGYVQLDTTGMTWTNDWGLHIDDDGTFYATNSLQNQNVPKAIYKFTPTDADFVNNTVFPPLVTSIGGDNVINVGEMELPDEHGIMGITTDADGNIYVVIGRFTANATNPARTKIMKYDPNGAFISETAWDDADDGNNPDGTGGGGWYQSVGIVYSETLDNIFVSSGSINDGCISQFDTDLNFIASYLPSADGGGKGIGILKECCPNPSTLVIDTLLCDLTYPTDLFLQDLINCDGIICEGQWTPDPANTGMVFNDCNNSVTISGDQACGTFTLFSDGSSALSQCGQFSITVNIETAITPTISVTGDQNFCPGDVPTDLVATSNGVNSTYQWQMSSTSCTGPWTDIAGATSTTYTPPNTLTSTTYYQVIASEAGGCATGSCDAISDCVTITVENCVNYAARLSKSVSPSTASIGSTVTYTIIVENEGDAVTGAVVSDPLATGLSYGGSYTATTGTYDGTNWTIGNMAAGQIDSIQITATVTADGVITNTATLSINEIEDNITNNTDEVCISVPISVCDSDTINIDIMAEAGYTNYQWYKDGVAIVGATAQIYTATEAGTYTYTVDGAGPSGDCMGELCCPVIIEVVSCCPPTQCLPISITINRQ